MSILKPGLFSIRSIKGKVTWVLITVGSFMVLSIAYTNYRIDKQGERQRALLAVHQPAIAATHQLQSALSQATFLLGAYLESGNEGYYRNWEDEWNIVVEDALAKLDVQVQGTEDRGSQLSITKLSIATNNLKLTQTEMISNIKRELKSEGFYDDVESGTANSFFYMQGEGNEFSRGRSLFATKSKYSWDFQQSLVPNTLEVLGEAAVLRSHIENVIDQEMKALEKHMRHTRTVNYTLAFIMVVVAVVLGVYLVRWLIKHIILIRQPLRKLSVGNIPDLIPENKNETNLIVKAVNQVVHHMETLHKLSETVSAGDLEARVRVFENKGVLGKSLASMRYSLREVAKEDKLRNWTNEGLNAFNDILRLHNRELGKLCSEVLMELVKYVGAVQGSIFLLNAHEDTGATPTMEMRSTYAGEKWKYLRKSVVKGESLIGQSWQEERTIYLTEIPDEFVKIRSGLGQANPRNILIVPMMANEEIVGIIELASFTVFEKHIVRFVERLSQNVASSILSTSNNEKTAMLLVESKEHAEELRAQEEELKQNMEELQATQEEMRRAQGEIARKEADLKGLINNTADTIFAIDHEYRITVVNQVLKNKYLRLGISLEEGSHIYDVLPGDAWTKWKPRYDRALQGEQYAMVDPSKQADGSIKYSETFHNPIKNEHDEVIGASVISRDVTESILIREEAMRQSSTLKALINSTDDTFFALDQEYRILVANEALQARFRPFGIELTEGMDIFEVLPKEQHEKWRERYRRALTGETFTIPEERKLKDRTLFIESHHYPIFNEEGQVVGAIVSSRDITALQEAKLKIDHYKAEVDRLQVALGLEATGKRNAPRS